MEEVRAGPMSLAKFTSGWVAPGVPRWKAYVIYVLSLVTGLFLALTPGAGGTDFLAYLGIALIGFGVFGLVETASGRKLWRPRPRR